MIQKVTLTIITELNSFSFNISPKKISKRTLKLKLFLLSLLYFELNSILAAVY